jgi:chromosome segregation ATPase
MKERKFRKQIADVIQDNFHGIDMTLAQMLLAFKQLYEDITTYESRILKLENAVQDLREDTVLTQSGMAKAIIKNHRLKRQLKWAHLKADFIYGKTVAFRNELSDLKNEIATLKDSHTTTTKAKDNRETARNTTENTVNGATA